MPKRGDFEVEYDNDAELLLAEMEFTDEDTEEERAMKFRLIDIYNEKLNERIRRKEFVINRGLLDLKEQIKLDRNRTKEEKEMYNMLKVFARFNTAEDHERLVQAVIKERQIRQRIEELKEFKKKGFRTLAEIDEELDGKKKKEERMRKKDLESFGLDKVNFPLCRAKLGECAKIPQTRRTKTDRCYWAVKKRSSAGGWPSPLRTSS
jgi:transcriptional adapter 2-alpha